MALSGPERETEEAPDKEKEGTQPAPEPEEGEEPNTGKK